jgi:hypothetical protein
MASMEAFKSFLGKRFLPNEFSFLSFPDDSSKEYSISLFLIDLLYSLEKLLVLYLLLKLGLISLVFRGTDFKMP